MGGEGTKNSTLLVNDTNKVIHLYKGSSNRNTSFRGTLYPRSQPNHATTFETNDATFVTSQNEAPVITSNDSAQFNTKKGVPTYCFKEELDTTDTYGMLTVFDSKECVLSISTDQMIDNEVITIKCENGKFKAIFTARSSKQAAHHSHGETSSSQRSTRKPTDQNTLSSSRFSSWFWGRSSSKEAASTSHTAHEEPESSSQQSSSAAGKPTDQNTPPSSSWLSSWSKGRSRRSSNPAE